MSAVHADTGGKAPYYYVPSDSPHPIRTSISLLLMFLGAALWINSMFPGRWMFLVGLIGLFVSLFLWFRDAIRESEGGLNSQKVDHAYRWSMAWFIFSEVMFFSAFFGALWYAREITTPMLADLEHRTLLWPEFTAQWPNLGPGGIIPEFKTVGPFWLPTINTALLLSSGLTLTISHHALRADHRGKAIFWLVKRN